MKDNIVKVTIWGKDVGYLMWDSFDWKHITSVFQFSKEFLRSGLDISPLRMPIDSKWVQEGKAIRPGDPKGPFKGLPSVFADSLPDHWGNSIFRAWAREHGVKMKTFTPVDFLSFIGTRSMGALEYHPAFIKEEDIPFDVNVNLLYAFAKSVLNDMTEITYSTDRQLLWQDLIKLGTSPGGKRPKALIAINEQTGEVKSGQTMLPAGFNYYILKYDNEKDDLPYARIEYAYYQMCNECGINIMPSQLRRFDNASHFITRRFDRVDGQKVHRMSLMAMNGDTRSYEEAFGVIRKLDLNHNDTEQLFRQMVFNVVTGNIDDHSRNFTFLMNQSGKWSLAPAYDMVYSIDPDTLYVQKGQFMSINGKFNEISIKDMETVAHTNDVSNPATIVERTLDVLQSLPHLLYETGVSRATCDIITKQLNAKHESLGLPRPYVFNMNMTGNLTFQRNGNITPEDKEALESLGLDEQQTETLRNTGKLSINSHNYRPANPWDNDVPKVNSTLNFAFHDGTVYLLTPDRKREVPLQKALRDIDKQAIYSEKNKGLTERASEIPRKKSPRL